LLSVVVIRSAAKARVDSEAFGSATRREGDALETLSVDLPEKIDLVLLDGAKSLYPEILRLLESRLRPGALIVADNADMSPDYLKHVRSPGNGYMCVPFAEDVELSMRIV
jgi:predicted O-methyltransferase YrrM